MGGLNRIAVMARHACDRCASCGIPFVIVPLWEDYISKLQVRGLNRTLDFDYEFYNNLFAQERTWKPVDQVTMENCDSIFLGDVIDAEMKCPKCGKLAFLDEMETYLIVVGKTTTGYSAHCPDVLGCAAIGNTVDNVVANMKKAMELHFEGMVKDGIMFPKPGGEEFYRKVADDLDFEQYSLAAVQIDTSRFLALAN
jgi:predicted RNase H-like HicB family nuclease